QHFFRCRNAWQPGRICRLRRFKGCNRDLHARPRPRTRNGEHPGELRAPRYDRHRDSRLRRPAGPCRAGCPVDPDVASGHSRGSGERSALPPVGRGILFDRLDPRRVGGTLRHGPSCSIADPRPARRDRLSCTGGCPARRAHHPAIGAAPSRSLPALQCRPARRGARAGCAGRPRRTRAAQFPGNLPGLRRAGARRHGCRQGRLVERVRRRSLLLGAGRLPTPLSARGALLPLAGLAGVGRRHRRHAVAASVLKIREVLMSRYDVVVIGAGPGGYVCAIKAAQLGLKTAIIEKRPTFGGTCVNVGCIPSKALLQASEKFAEVSHLAEFGVEVGKPKLNLKQMLAHKDQTVEQNTKGLVFLMKKNKIDTFQGTGRIAGKGKVAVALEGGGEETLETGNIVIATGSDVAGIPGVDVAFDERVIVSSTGALSFSKVPGHLVVVGGGVIGLELGSVWARLGAKVTVVEYLDTILGGMDGEVARQMQRLLAKQGLEFRLGAKVTGVAKAGKGARVTFEPVKGGEAETIEADAVLVATGRKPYTEGLGLEEVGVELDERGRVKTDAHLRTSVEGIYAIGDVVAGPMLAHKGEDEGVAVAEIIAGQAGHEIGRASCRGRGWTRD